MQISSFLESATEALAIHLAADDNANAIASAANHAALHLLVTLVGAATDLDLTRRDKALANMPTLPSDCAAALRTLPVAWVSVPADGAKAAVLRAEVAALLCKKATEVVQVWNSPGFYSHIFVVPKPGGRWRPVIDLSALNSYIDAPRFRMETAASVRASTDIGDFADRDFLLDLLRTLGFLVNSEKSDLLPSQRFTHLGMAFATDVNRASLPQKRIDAILEAVASLPPASISLCVDASKEGWGAHLLPSFATTHGRWSPSDRLICQRWERPQIDLFATRWNNKLPTFVSPVPDPTAWAVDALSIPWDGFVAYAYPPTVLIPKVLQKLENSTGKSFLGSSCGGNYISKTALYPEGLRREVARVHTLVADKDDVVPQTLSYWLRSVIKEAYSDLSPSAAKLLKIRAHEAFIWDSPRLEHEAANDCDLTTAGDLFGRSGLGIGLKKGSMWTHSVSLAVLELHESVFMMVAGGIVAGVLLIFIEIAYKRYRGMKEKELEVARNAADRWRGNIEKRRTLRQTLQKQREEQMRAANALQAKKQEANTEGNNMPTPPYRRPSLMEATGSNALGPAHFSPGHGSATRYSPSHGSPTHFSPSPGAVRSGRTVTWHNPAHNPDFSVI
nr:hypothetical protein BaRGS_032088 [Batillaria attramentaria]